MTNKLLFLMKSASDHKTSFRAVNKTSEIKFMTLYMCDDNNEHDDEICR